MAPHLVLVLVGLLFVLFFGVLSLLRREGISMRFTAEAILFTALVAVIVALTGADFNPVFFAALLYVFTMRVRLLIDLGNFFARRRDYEAAERVYSLALRLGPDETGRLLVRLNQGVLALHRNQPEAAVVAFREVLAASESGYLGIKSMAAGHYNLGVAYQRQGLDAQASLEFNKVLETWPVTEYARYARIALERRKQRSGLDEPSGNQDSASS